MKILFFKDIDQDHARAVSRSTAFRMGMLFGPAALLLAVIRLLEHSMLKAMGVREVGAVLGESAAPLFSILFVTMALGWAAYAAWPYVRPVWVMAGTVILGAGLLFWAKILLPPWMAGWVNLDVFQVLRWDLLTLLVLALACALIVDRLDGWMRVVSLGLIHALIPLLLLLPIFELGVILSMGSPLDGSLLSYSIRHLGELAPVLASEMSPFRVMLLALPLLITLLPLVLERLPALRRWILDAAPGTDVVPAWQAALAPVPLVLLLALAPSTELPPTHRTISYAGMTQSILEDTNFEPDDLAGLTTPAAPPFDTRTLRFVPTDTTRRLNVVVVILESVRSRSTTPYNPTLATTPFLDDLARRSLLVENMYALISYTNKSLVPILGGVYPELSRDIVEGRPGAVPAAGLPALLQPHGYRSAFFTPAQMAFENKDVILQNLGFEGIYGDATYDKTSFDQANYFGYEDRVMLEPSLAWVDETVAQDQPFFLSYLTLTAHHSYHTPESFGKKQFDDDEHLNDYLNAVYYTDAFLKDLFDGFERRGLIDSTLFIILSDHGEAFGEHGQKTHGDVIWDEAMQVPALVYNPVLFPESGRIAGNRSQIDVMPTIADALGYRIEGGLYPGFSLLQDVPEGRAVYHSARDANLAMAMRQDSLKFFYFNRRQPMQVFDTRNDPQERFDLAAQISPSLLKTVELKLLLWRRGVQLVYQDQLSPDEFFANVSTNQ